MQGGADWTLPEGSACRSSLWNPRRILPSPTHPQLRRDQAIHLAWKAAEEGLLEDLRSSQGVQAALGTLRPQLAAGSLGVRPAAEAMLAALRAEWSSGQGLVEGIRR